MLIPDLDFGIEMARADSDPDAPARAYLGIAKKWRTQRALKPDVIDFIIDAFEKSMILPQKEQGPALLRALKLTHGSRRPSKVSWFDVGMAFDEFITSGESRTNSLAEIAIKFDISESTVVRFVKNYHDYEEERSREDTQSQVDRENFE
jgi:hypothetical protein